MGLDYSIHAAQRLVVAKGHGTLTDSDIFNYQRDVWSRVDVLGFNELMDMTAVEQIEMPSIGRAKQLSAVSAKMDETTVAPASKFAIVAVTELHYGLARMYSSWRNSDPRSKKEAKVFRNKAEAFAWLGVEDPLGESGRTRI